MIKVIEKYQITGSSLLETLQPVTNFNTPEIKELIKLGCDMKNAKIDYGNSFFDVRVDHDLLKKYGYKFINTTSNDPTISHYTNGKWVVSSIASQTGWVSICKLGSKAKKVIDSGEEFDVWNDDFTK